MFGSVLKAARIGFFFGLAAVGQKRIYRVPNLLRGGALICSLVRSRNRGRLSRRRGDAVSVSLACPALAMGDDPALQTVGRRPVDQAGIEQEAGDFKSAIQE